MTDSGSAYCQLAGMSSMFVRNVPNDVHVCLGGGGLWVTAVRVHSCTDSLSN